ncbi:EAL domain-containing protein [Pseudomonas sp. LS44]|uniref:bifunctional diguanylate cyclase/phosphodiesterase n=1 Tax=Pseudomonas sp. LS44 TaxID=1357074 RepID=UPI00215ADF6E|nr:EAL domain-containing protein [Pseudomonas sp. LS44]UVE17602.1 EAL domain-containing protein [Pseudomonas sp. LS44]
MLAVHDRRPKWTWWLPLPLLHLASWLSYLTQQIDGIALWYLPFALGLVFVLWWGPRVLPAVYLNALVCVPLWNLPWAWAPLYALPETLAIGVAWLLLRRDDFDVALPNINQLLRFILLGGLVPVTLLALGLQATLLLSGHLQVDNWAPVSLSQWLLDSLIILVVAPPLLTYGTLWLRQPGWVATPPGGSRLPLAEPLRCLPPWPLLLVLLVGLPGLLNVLPLPFALPLMGLVLLGLALRWGLPGAFCGAALSGLALSTLTLVPSAMHELIGLAPQISALHVSVLLLLFAALLVGRSLSDLRMALGRGVDVQQQLALANVALEASPTGVSIADARQADLPLIYCNAAFERISGYTREEILGQNCRFLQGRDRNQSELQRLRSALQQGESCQVVLRNYRKNGSLFWNEIILAPMRDGQGISHFVALQHDVSARETQGVELAKRREELLRQTHLLAQTEAIADIGGWVLNLRDSSMFWSEGCFRIFELDPSGVTPSLEQTLRYFDDENRRQFEQALARTLEHDAPFDLELRLLSARGNSRYVRIKGLAERDGDQAIRLYGALQDLSMRKRAEEQLRERDEWLRLFFEAPLIGMAMIDPQRLWLEVNTKLCQVLGRSRDELCGSTWSAITHADDLALEEPLFEAVKAGTREDYEVEKRFLRADASVVYTRLSLRAVRDAQGCLEACLVLVEDITARRDAEARYRTLVEHAPEAILMFDTQRGIVEANENAVRLLGLPRGQLIGRMPTSFSPLLQPDGRPSLEVARAYARAALEGETPVFEWLMRDAAGRQRPCEVRLVRLPGGERPLVRLSVTDISERQRYQREIERLAFSDELTGLPNRRLLLDRLQQAMAREHRESSFGALLFIDLDHFKTVNDSLGHPVGDALLREVTARLAGCLRAEDTLARLGGDEFVVLLEALGDSPAAAGEHAAEVGEKLLASLLGSYQIDQHELSVSASIGIALHPLGTQGAADVLKQADTAMYRAKHGGRNALHFFAPEMQAVIDQRLLLQSELRQAMARGQLHLVFQPQLALASGEVAGAEVLLRWRHPERGEIPPSQFIPLAEDTGLIQELGAWVLENACTVLARWHAQWPQLVLAVNLSPRELRQTGLVARVSDCLQRHRLPASVLELEITEGVLLEDVDQCIAAMHALKALGVRFAIDDFGTGYSSLTYLKRLPLDRLKIDRSFISDLENEGSGRMLVETILVIARNLGLECIAEGVENHAQAEHLRLHDCALGQGYYFGEPMDEATFAGWLGAYQRTSTHV